jgi:hypothetical protein
VDSSAHFQFGQIINWERSKKDRSGNGGPGIPALTNKPDIGAPPLTLR